MSFFVVFLVIVGVLFGTVYITKRRVGVIGLALAAGAMLSSLWVGDLTPVIAKAGIVLVKPPLESVVSAMLILLPAFLLLFSGPTYQTVVRRIIGAAAFSLLAITLLLEPLGSALVIDATGRPLYDFLAQHRALIITASLIFALIDLFMAKTPKHNKESGKH